MENLSAESDYVFVYRVTLKQIIRLFLSSHVNVLSSGHITC